jgi:molybdate-binding protein
MLLLAASNSWGGHRQHDANLASKILPGLEFSTIEWARRLQGLVVAPGNPLKITSIHDLRGHRARAVMRHAGWGDEAFLKFAHETT